jgi:hypothetical protein
LRIIMRQGSLYLDLPAHGGTTATSALELATLGENLGADSGVGDTGGAEVASSNASGLLATEEDAVSTLGAEKSKLIESVDLATVLHDTGTDGVSNAESSELEALDDLDTDIISDGADNNDDVLGVILEGGLGVLLDALDGHNRAVNVRAHKAAKDGSVEGAASTASEELVKADKETEIDVLALAVSALGELLTATG